MLLLLILSAAAFIVAMAALVYDPEEQALRFPLWDHELGRPFLPNRFILIGAGASLAIFIASLVTIAVEATSAAHARSEAERQGRRIRTLISQPDVIITAEFSEDDLRKRAATSPDASARLNQLLALIRETPIPPDPCSGIALRRGSGAIPLIGEMLNADGGLSLADFSMALGFYLADKDISQFAKTGFDLFDMTLGVNGNDPDAEFTYLPDTKIFRLVMTDTGSGLATNPDTMTSTADLPGAIVVLEPATPTNAYERGFVKSLFLRDKLNHTIFGIDFSVMKPITGESGWPPHSMIATLPESIQSCIVQPKTGG